MLAANVNEKHGDKLDPGNLAKQVGTGGREAREFRDSFTGSGASQSPEPKPAATPKKGRGDSDL